MRESTELVDGFLSEIIDRLPYMVFLKAAGSLQFVLMNRAGEALVGATRDQLLGKSDHDFFPKEQADSFVDKDRAVLASGAESEVEEPIQTPRGERWLLTRKVALMGADGLPRFLLGISVDITERRAAEQAGTRAGAELRQTVEQLVALEGLAILGQAALDTATHIRESLAAGDTARALIHAADLSSIAATTPTGHDRECDVSGALDRWVTTHAPGARTVILRGVPLAEIAPDAFVRALAAITGFLRGRGVRDDELEFSATSADQLPEVEVAARSLSLTARTRARLGLDDSAIALARACLASSGGVLTVESRGQGSVFRLRLVPRS